MQELSLTDRLYWREMGRLAWRRATHILAVSGVCRDVLVKKVGIEPTRFKSSITCAFVFLPVPKSQIPADLLHSKGLMGPISCASATPIRTRSTIRPCARLRD